MCHSLSLKNKKDLFRRARPGLEEKPGVVLWVVRLCRSYPTAFPLTAPHLGVTEDQHTPLRGTGDGRSRGAGGRTSSQGRRPCHPSPAPSPTPGPRPSCPSPSPSCRTSYRGDDCRHPNGLLEDQRPPVSCGGADDVSVDAAGFLREPLQEKGGIDHLPLRLLQWLPLDQKRTHSPCLTTKA